MLGTEHFQQKQDQVSKVTNVNNIVRVHLLQDNNIHVYLMLCVFVYICMDVHTYKLINFYYVNLFSKMNGFIIFLGPFLILEYCEYHAGPITRMCQSMEGSMTPFVKMSMPFG